MTSLGDATTLITGGASGLGRLVAARIVARGGRVVLVDVNQEALDDVAAALGGRTGQVRTARCDVTDRAAVMAVRDDLVADGAAVDVVVNSAGVVSGAPVLELTEDQIRRTFDVNTVALFWLTQAFLPGMLERRRGHLVTIASASGLIGVARLTDYAASKWAAVGFDESMRMELGRRSPVRTTVVCPYYIDTGMFAGVKSRIPRLLPILDPDDVADRIVGAIERNRRRLLLPPMVRTLALARLLPVGAFDRLADVLGINRSMDEFVGRRP